MIGEERKSLKQNTSFSKRAGGAPANVAVTASRLGADVEMVATVGEDEFGDFLVERLTEEDVDTTGVRRVKYKTSMAFASLDKDAKPHFSFYRSADQRISTEQLDEGAENIIHIGSLPWTNQVSAESVIDFIESLDTDLSFDPNLRDELLSEDYVAVLKVIAENSQIFVAAEDELEVFGGLEELKKHVREIVVTKGSEGAELYTGDQKYTVKAPETEVVDTTGAGDALTGAYLAFRSKGPEKALQKAVEAASISTKSKGAMESLPYRQELE